MKTLATLTRYKAWADTQLYDALTRLPQDELVAPRPIVFGSILRTLNHVHAMDTVWRAHLAAATHGYTTRNPAECPEFAQLRSAQEEMDRWFIDCAESLDDRSADDVVEFTFIGGGPGRMTRGEIVLHVVNHTTYHRGHIADMMASIKRPAPTTDLPVYLKSLL